MKGFHSFFLQFFAVMLVAVPLTSLSAEYVKVNDVEVYINDQGEHKTWINSFPEYLQPMMQNNEWYEVTSQKMHGASLHEFLPKGQTLKNWTEIVSTMYYHYYRIGRVTSSIEAVEAFMGDGKSVCGPKGKFTYKILSQTHKETVYRWTMKGCGTGNLSDQTEFGRFILGKYGYHNITYSIKSTVITPEKEDYALEMVKTAKMRVDDRCGKGCLFKEKK